jgi:hypothetical protein
MNVSSLVCPSTRQHHQLISHRLTAASELMLDYQWLRDKVEHGYDQPDFIPTGEMIVPAPKVHFLQRTDGCVGLASFLILSLSIYILRHARSWGDVKYILKVGITRNQLPYVMHLYKRQERQNMNFGKMQMFWRQNFV